MAKTKPRHPHLEYLSRLVSYQKEVLAHVEAEYNNEVGRLINKAWFDMTSSRLKYVPHFNYKVTGLDCEGEDFDKNPMPGCVFPVNHPTESDDRCVFCRNLKERK